MSRTEWMVLVAIAALVTVMVALEPDHADMDMGEHVGMSMEAAVSETVVDLAVSGMT